MDKHDEYTLYKKENKSYVIRFMMAPFGLWTKDYQSMKTKPYLVIKYNKEYDKDVPRKKGEKSLRKNWIKHWKSYFWYDTSEEALTKYKSL